MVDMWSKLLLIRALQNRIRKKTTDLMIIQVPRTLSGVKFVISQMQYITPLVVKEIWLIIHESKLKCRVYSLFIYLVSLHKKDLRPKSAIS